MSSGRKPRKGAQKGNIGERLGSALSTSEESFLSIIGDLSRNCGHSDKDVERAVLETGRSLNSIIDRETLSIGFDSLLSSGGYTGEVVGSGFEGGLKPSFGVDLDSFDRGALREEIIAKELQAPLSEIRDDLYSMSRGTLGPLTLVQKDMLDHVMQRLQRVEALQTDLMRPLPTAPRPGGQRAGQSMFQDILDEVLGRIKEEGMSRDISLRLQMPEMGWVSCDTGLVKQAMNDFLYFALRSSRSGEVVTAGGLSDGKEFCLWVRLKKGGHGTGGQGLNELRANLNLAQVRKLIASNSGRLWAEDENDKEALHFLSVPFSEGEIIPEDEYYSGVWDFQI